MPHDTPAHLTLDVSINPHLKGGQGRPPKCLLSTLRTDVEKVGLNLRNAKGLEKLRRLAAGKD